MQFAFHSHLLTGFVVDVFSASDTYEFQQKLKRTHKGSYHFSNSIKECLFSLAVLLLLWLRAAKHVANTAYAM